MDDVEVLARSELFAGVPRERLATLMSAASRRSLIRNDVLFAEGDAPDQLYVVLNGRIAIANRSVDGRESVMALMESGNLFGEMGLLDGLPRSAEARALEPSSVLALPYAPVRRLFEDDPTLLWGVVIKHRVKAVYVLAMK